METFGKSALRYKYFWPAEDKDKTFMSYYDDDIIDRRNGYQLLNLINHFMKIHGLTNLGSLHKMEWMICKYMPQDIVTRNDIEDWLRKNWGQRVYFY